MATGYNILGDVHRRAGLLDEAEANLRKSLELPPTVGFDAIVSDSLLSLALTAAERGRYDEALALVDDAIERGRRATSALSVARALVGRGFILLTSGQVDDAEQSLRHGLEEAERLDLAYLVVEAEACLARVVAMRGDLHEARALAGRSFDELSGSAFIGTLQPAEVYRACWQALVDCGDQRAQAALDAGRAYLDEMAKRIDDDELRASFLQRVPANVWLAQG